MMTLEQARAYLPRNDPTSDAELSAVLAGIYEIANIVVDDIIEKKFNPKKKQL